MLEDTPTMTLHSLLFSLDYVVGTERIVRARRDFIRVTDYALSFRGVPRFVSGSRAEGFDMKGSDIDCMVPVPGVKVSSGNFQDCKITDHVLLMRCEGIHPGFTLLEVVRIGQPCPGTIPSEVFLSLTENVAFNINYLSSEKSTDYYWRLFQGVNRRIHGPCVSGRSELSGLEHDFGTCLAGTTWPLQANAWITRHRSSGFPSQDFIQTLKTLPCYLMAIGSKLSPIPSLEWRLSFSVQEKEIICTMNHSQFKVYGLLKLLLKEVLNVRLPDVLCSYYMKTALFWLAEEIPRHCWQDRNFILCFMACLQRITEWAHAGYCPNYFIPENNMFDGKMDETVRKSATRVLCQVMSEGWGIVFRCESLSRFTVFWHTNQEHTLSLLLQMDSECVGDIYTFKSQAMFVVYVNSVEKSVIVYLDMLQSIEEDLSDMDPGYIRCIIAILHSSIGAMYCAMGNADGMSNRERYPLLRQARHHFSEGVKRDISNGRLKFATFRYVNGEYSKALALVNSFLSDYGPYVVHVYSVDGLTMTNITEHSISCYNGLFCSKGLGIDRKRQQAVMEDVEFMQCEYNYLPSPVQCEIKTMSSFIEQDASINPVVYAYYLSFRCFEETKRRAESQRALRSLEELLDDDERIPAEQIHQVYNFAAHCHVVLGDHVTARRLLHASMDIQPHLNAASLMLNEL